MKVAILLLILPLGAWACSSEEKFPSLGDKVASPVDVAVSDNQEYFYVLNADFDRTYNQGSVLVLDQEGNKVNQVEVPRMGRTLTVAGNDMLVTVDVRDEDQGAEALLFDITEPTAPQLKARFPLECHPFGAVMRKGYPYFAISCLNGPLYIGKLADDRAASTLHHVRSYGISRRALHLDPKRGLLFGFVSDHEQNKLADVPYPDVTTFDAEANEVLVNGERVPNEVPDTMEDTKRRASNLSVRRVFQFFVYDIEAEKDACLSSQTEGCAFPFRPTTDPLVEREMRWIYFSLANFDGAPDLDNAHFDPNLKYYRTNFWDAKPDPIDPDVFYLSHRGRPDQAPFSNQIIRVTIVGNLRAASPDAPPPPTGQTLTFERVYGFKGQGLSPAGQDFAKFHYPGTFAIAEVNSQKVLVVNHFRDLVHWGKNDRYFSLAAQVVDDPSWFTEIQGSATAQEVTTYYQVAINRHGRAISCSYYGNAVILLQVNPGLGMEALKRIH